MRTFPCRFVYVFASLVVLFFSIPASFAVSLDDSTNPPQGFATLYIYRTPHEIGRFVWPEVFVGDALIVGLKDGTYTGVHIRPGRFSIKTEKGSFFSGMGNIPGEIEITKEGIYFLKLDRAYNQFYEMGSPTFTKLYERWVLVPESSARKEISSLEYIAPNTEAVAP